MLSLLNILFTLAHLVLIIFNLTGWIWKKTRVAHLIVLGLTTASWFILGIWYGWGYCPLTDWHWDVKEKMGETQLPNSFIKYFADEISGKDIPASLVDNITLACLIFAILAAVYVNFIHRKNKAAGLK
jgi:Na+/H+-dicarboxylate symporter